MQRPAAFQVRSSVWIINATHVWPCRLCKIQQDISEGFRLSSVTKDWWEMQFKYFIKDDKAFMMRCESVKFTGRFYFIRKRIKNYGWPSLWFITYKLATHILGNPKSWLCRITVVFLETNVLLVDDTWQTLVWGVFKIFCHAITNSIK